MEYWERKKILYDIDSWTGNREHLKDRYYSLIILCDILRWNNEKRLTTDEVGVLFKEETEQKNPQHRRHLNRLLKGGYIAMGKPVTMPRHGILVQAPTFYVTDLDKLLKLKIALRDQLVEITKKDEVIKRG